MKRDPDLVRDILLAIEATPKDSLMKEVLPDRDQREVNYHLIMLAEAGYIRFEASRSSSNPDRLIEVWPFGLTWDGHDFLDTVRDPKIWAQTKDGALAAGGFTFDLLKDLAKGFLRKQIERLTDVDL